MLVRGSVILWAVPLLVPRLPWRNREVSNASDGVKPALDDITVVIPARNSTGLSFLLMATSDLPTLYFYGRNPAWVLGLPVVALLYLGMAWTSAWRYRKGEKSRWKNRLYAKEMCSEDV